MLWYNFLLRQTKIPKFSEPYLCLCVCTHVYLYPSPPYSLKTGSLNELEGRLVGCRPSDLPVYLSFSYLDLFLHGCWGFELSFSCFQSNCSYPLIPLQSSIWFGYILSGSSVIPLTQTSLILHWLRDSSLLLTQCSSLSGLHCSFPFCLGCLLHSINDDCESPNPFLLSSTELWYEHLGLWLWFYQRLQVALPIWFMYHLLGLLYCSLNLNRTKTRIIERLHHTTALA